MADQGQQEQGAGDHGGDGIAGEAEHDGAAQPADDQRLAGAHGDPPEVDGAAGCFQRGADEIMIAHRCAAGGDDDVGVPRGGERRADGGEIVAGKLLAVDDAAGRLRHGAQHDAVGGGQPAGGQGAPGRTSSSPVERMATRGRARTGSAPWAGKSGEGDLDGAEAHADGEQRRSALEIAAAQADVAAFIAGGRRR